MEKLKESLLLLRRRDPQFYIALGLAFALAFGVITAAYGEWDNLIMLAVIAVTLAISYQLVYTDHAYVALHFFAGSLVVCQSIILYLYRDTASVGLVWFVIVPAIVGSFGRRREVLIWTPLSLGALLLAYSYVAEWPSFQHPLSLPNLIGALVFTSITCYRFLLDRDQRERHLQQAIDRAEAEVERRRLAETEAREAEQRTTRFLASMSHELRSPMTGMMLSAELLEQDKVGLGADARSAIDRIHESARITLNLVSDVLDLAKVDAGKMRVSHEVIELEPLLEDVRLLMEPSAQANHTRLCVLFGPELPVAIHSDPACVRQVLINLVSNAIKHTSRGSVLVEAEARGDSLEFFVTDSGIGIPEDQQQRIFDPFVQLAEATQLGTGLGLTLAREYSQLVGGELVLVRSELGIGSRFRFAIPCLQMSDGRVGDLHPAVELPGVSWRPASKLPALVDWARAWLEHWGGQEDPTGRLFDLDERELHACGSVHELAERLGVAQVLGSEREASTTLPASRRRNRGRCLVCDDNDMIRDVFGTVLDSLGYETQVVATGDEVIDSLRGSGPQVLFLDVQLAKESGIDVLRRLRELPDPASRTPVCMISGSTIGQEEALASGADEFLLKPPAIRDVSQVAASLWSRVAEPEASLS